MTATRPTRFAIVGLGYGSTRCALFADTPGAELAAVVDANPERASTFGERYNVLSFTDHRQVLERNDVDVVAICTPTGLHRDIAIDVARAGKHVLLTKPLETTLERSDDIIRACASAGVNLFCEFYARYAPDNYRAYRAIQEGLLGKLILGDFGFKCFRPAAYYSADGGWRATRELQGGGVTMNQMVHAIDMLWWYMGDVESVQALTGTFSYDIPVEDTSAALLKMRSGAIATVVGTSTFRTTSGHDDMYGGGFTSRSEVNGDLGSITVTDEHIQMVKLERGTLPEVSDRPLNVFGDIAATLADPDRASPALARGGEARRSVEIASAIYESVRTGGRVLLEPSGGPGVAASRPAVTDRA
jgi:UDP-N-acetyl-2-amino-2-deoxyglucuronate dehydrogenase